MADPEPISPPAHYDRLAELIATFPLRDRRLAEQMVQSMVELFGQHPATIDLKITSAAIAEMSDAFAMFAPYRERPKVTIFGSARTLPDDPLYVQARDVADVLAGMGWMVITGAGPGIMHAAMEGAGRENSIGVSIKLPFEQGANPIIAGDSKYVSMKYFFTRKLMLIKESRGFVCLPGGFGTLDETFELLTLTQTGKGAPVPIVLLDTPGDPYWETVHDFVGRQLVQRGLVSEADTGLYLVTEDCQVAADEITRFYANYDSLRYVGDLLAIRVRHEPTDEQIELLNERFGHLCRRGVISRSAPLDPERKDADRLDLYRITFAFAKHGYGELRAMIDTLNGFVPAEEVEPPVEAPVSAASLPTVEPSTRST
ncbi:MAG: TIGR00730 family Rossman fold protein [Ilumatobacteraceae bacterium]